MPIVYEDELIHFDGHCTVEEALPLTEFLGEVPTARVSLGDCLSLHASLLQTLLASRPTIVDLPKQPPLSTAMHRLFGGD